MVYFEGDSSTVDGPKFKAALGSAVIALGVSPDGIVSINLQVGSIIAEINLVGMEFGRMINEAMENRLLVVLVDGVAFVGYATYDEIDPFFDQVCEGYHLGNMTFPLADFPSPQQLDGFVERGAIVPSERHVFQTELNTKVQLVATAQYREDGFKPVICVVATIVEVDSRSVLVDIIVSRASPEFDQFDQAFYDRLSEAIAIGYTSGDLNVQVGDTVVSAQDVDLKGLQQVLGQMVSPFDTKKIRNTDMVIASLKTLSLDVSSWFKGQAAKMVQNELNEIKDIIDLAVDMLVKALELRKKAKDILPKIEKASEKALKKREKATKQERREAKEHETHDREAAKENARNKVCGKDNDVSLKDEVMVHKECDFMLPEETLKERCIRNKMKVEEAEALVQSLCNHVLIIFNAVRAACVEGQKQLQKAGGNGLLGCLIIQGRAETPNVQVV